MNPETKTFMCANIKCHYHSRQSIDKVAQKLEDFKLCQDCYSKGLRLQSAIIVDYEKV
jgi:hypothetical protein